MKRISVFAPLIAIAFVLSACGNGAEDVPVENGEPGEVLEGSVSDAMLPLGETQSQGDDADLSEDELADAAAAEREDRVGGDGETLVVGADGTVSDPEPEPEAEQDDDGEDEQTD